MSSARAAVLVCGLLACLGSAAAHAQETRIITFEEAIRIALEQNVPLRQTQNAAEAARIAVSQARARFAPDLAVSSRGGRSFGRTFSEAEGRIIDNTIDTVNVSVSSGVTLFDGFANVAGLREARFDETASALEVERARETVVFTVASNFLALVQQQEELRVRRESLAAESALAEQIASYVEAGTRTIADRYQQQANVANARLAVVEAERAARLAEVDLIETLQLDAAGVYQFEARPVAAVTAAVPALEAMLAQAYAHRTDLVAAENRVKAAEQSVRIAASGRWPTLSLSTGYGTSYTSASDFGIGEQFDQRRGGSVTLGVSIPIFDRGATSAAIRRAELAVDDARLDYEARRQEVGLDVRRAHLDYAAAREQLSAAEAQLEAARLALDATQERYEAGAATLVEVSQSRASLTQAASALVAARYGLEFQSTLIEYYTGRLSLAQSP